MRLVGKAFDPCQAGDEMMAKCFLGHYIQNSQKGGVLAGASTIFTLSEHQPCPLIDSSGPEGSGGRGHDLGVGAIVTFCT